MFLFPTGVLAVFIWSQADFLTSLEVCGKAWSCESFAVDLPAAFKRVVVCLEMQMKS